MKNLKISFWAYSLMVNSITRSLNSCNFDKKQRLETIFFVNKTMYLAFRYKKPFLTSPFLIPFLTSSPLLLLSPIHNRNFSSENQIKSCCYFNFISDMSAGIRKFLQLVRSFYICYSQFFLSKS